MAGLQQQSIWAQNEEDEEIARKWKAEEERLQLERIRDKGEWRSVEEVMEELAPKRKRIAGPSTTEESDVMEVKEKEKPRITVGSKRKGRS
ncbi:uncharacterized protein KY384_006130 [Bacidia gigantensis]|uniref:uncharacterized protein n=1 Tax=Bacidia gigantensis TaxID=2732470 RepID=UPI001D04BCC4|nr:uncharacterized protein KY384_006130 [Bacidia gigantensis]KAG8529493.1 hypothetical protein KY384_006130 [Bacidia gigantensis]